MYNIRPSYYNPIVKKKKTKMLTINVWLSFLFLISLSVDRVILTFTYINIEPSEGCLNDSVTVRNGNDASASLVGRYCGDSVPAPIVSFGPSFTVQFITDNIRNYDMYANGFRLTYSTSVSCK